MPRASQTQPKESVVPSAPLPPKEKREDPKQIYMKRIALFAVLIIVFFWVYQSIAPRSPLMGLGVSDVTNLAYQIEMNDSYSMPMAPYAAPSPDRVNFAGGEMGMVSVSKAYPASVEIMPVPPFEQYPEPSSSDLPAEKKIIKNGNLHLLVDNSEYVAQAIAQTTNAIGGFVESTSFSNSAGDLRYGYMTIRVPSKDFDLMMSTIKTLANRVESESSSAQDVSAQYVDLEAQLKNYRVEEEKYVEIMDGATKTEDVLMVAARLSEVRGKIERTQGQLNLLSRQTGMSTISVTLQPVATASVESAAWRPRAVVSEAFKDVVAGLIGFLNLLLVMIVRLPLLLIQLTFLVLVLWGLVRLGFWGVRRVTGRPLPPFMG